MTKFIAIKVNYDSRADLVQHLKYTRIATPREYQEHLERYREKNKGGNGFHECLNFHVSEGCPTTIYVPPTCLPANSSMREEFVIFSFTYKADKHLPSCIIGVHAGATFHSTDSEGIVNSGQKIEGIGPLVYHAEAPSDLVTLFVPPIEYAVGAGLHTPPYERWGFGLRYLGAAHAAKILEDAFKAAAYAHESATVSEQVILEREMDVLDRICSRYGFAISKAATARIVTTGMGGAGPDRELGFLGEQFVYKRERAYVAKLKIDPKEVEWVSQADPIAPFDIKSVRLVDGRVEPHYIEVKSSAHEEVNVYVSSRQINFFNEHPDNASFAFVSFNRQRMPTGLKFMSLPEVKDTYHFDPIKFKLIARN
jgi:hypothetical protein